MTQSNLETVVAVFDEKFHNMEQNMKDGFTRLEKVGEEIKHALDGKADKKDLENKVSLDRFRPVEKNVSIAIGLLISTVLVAAIGFLLKAGLGL